MRIIKFLNFKKAVNLLGYFLSRRFWPEENIFQPISVDIEPTIFCNLNCVFCHNKELLRQKKIMKLDEFKKIMDNFPLAIRVNIQGMGEPLLNPDIAEMISYAKSQKKFITMTTNAMLLDESMAKKIIKSGLDRLIISLDSPSKECYENVRRGANFEKVVGNIEKFLKIRGKKRSVEVVIWMLGLESTVGGLIDMLKLVKMIGADKLVLQNQITGWGKKKWAEKAEELAAKNAGDIIAQAKKFAMQEKVNFSINNKYTTFKNDLNSRCSWPWGGVYVATDGSVVPCCLVADPEVKKMGNVLYEDFKDIWNNESYVNLRRDLKSGDIPEFCQRCYRK